MKPVVFAGDLQTSEESNEPFHPASESMVEHHLSQQSFIFWGHETKSGELKSESELQS